MPARAPASIDMLQTVIRSSMQSARIASPVYSMHVAGAAVGGDLADQIQDHVLGRDAGGQSAVDAQLERLGLRLQQRLRGQHVLDFAGADAEGQRPERAVRGGVAVAADDRHAGLREAQLGADDVDDALLRVVQVVQANAELPAVVAAACRSAASRSDRQSAACGRSSARCGRAWPRSAPAGGLCGRPAAGPRTPGGWSLRGPGADRCTGSSACPARHGRRGASQIFSNIVRGMAEVSGQWSVDSGQLWLNWACLAGPPGWAGPKHSSIRNKLPSRKLMPTA